MASTHTVQIDITAKNQADAVMRNVETLLRSLNDQLGQLADKGKRAGDQLKEGMGNAEKKVQSFGQALESVSSSLAIMGAAVTAVGASATMAFKEIIGVSAGFENTMLAVKAITQATDDQFKQLVKSARELNAATKFTGTEVGQGMQFLGMAGFKTTEIIAAMPATLNLAEATAMQLGQTADYVSNIMQGFGLKAAEAARATDVLAQTAVNSNTNVAQLAEAMKYLAPVSRAVGQSIEEAAAAVGILGNSGIQASMAGTSMRRMLLALTQPTEKASMTLERMGVQVARNADGNVNFVETLKRLRDANMSAAQAQDIFGIYALASALALTKDVDALVELKQKNDDATGSLDKMVGIMRSSFTGALTRLTSNFGNLIEIMGAPLLQPLATVVDGIAAVISKLSDFAQAYPTVAGVIAGGIGVFGLVASVIGVIGVTLAAVGFLMKPFSAGWEFLNQIMGRNVQVANQVTQTAGAVRGALQSEGAAVDQLARQYNQAVAAKERMYKTQAAGVSAGTPAGRGARAATGAAVGAAALGAGFLVEGASKGTSLEEQGKAAGTLLQTLGGVAIAAEGIRFAFAGLGAGILGSVAAVGALAAVVGAAVGGPMYLMLRSWGKQKQELHDAELATANLKATTTDAMAAMGLATLKSGKEQSDAIINVAQTYAKAGKSLDDLSNDYAANFGDKLPNEAKKAFESTKGEIDKFFTESSKKARDTEWVKTQMEDFIELKRAVGGAKPSFMEFNKIYKDAFGHDMPREHAALWAGIATREDRAREGMEAFDMAAIKAMENAQAGGQGVALSLKEVYEQTKKFAEQMLKREEELSKARMANIAVEEAAEKAAIAERISSNQQEQAALLELEIRTQTKRTQETMASALRRLTIEQDTYEKQRQNLEDQAAKAQNDKDKGDANKKLIELEQKHASDRVKIQAELTEKLAKELEAQYKKRAEYINKIQDLERQIQDVQRSTTQALRGLEIGAADSYAQLDMKLADASAKLREAESLFPKYPEKAVELAKQAQQEFAALGQAIATLKDNLANNFQSVKDTIRDIQNIGLKGLEKYNADREDVLRLMARADGERAAGRLKEAEALYKQAIQRAKALATSAPGNVRDAAKEDAIRIVETAGQRLKEVNQAQIDKAEQTNAAARDGIREAGELMEKNLRAQIESTQKLIAALDKNTEALRDRYEAARAGTAESGTSAPSEGGTAEPDRSKAADMSFVSSLPEDKKTSARGAADKMGAVLSGLVESVASISGAFVDQLAVSARGMQGQVARIQGQAALAGGGSLDADFDQFSSSVERLDAAAKRIEKSSLDIRIQSDQPVSITRGGGQYDD